MTRHTIRNARIVTADEELIGCVVIDGEIITAVDRSDTQARDADDWGGDWLLPGLVELHTDNLEKHLLPRPGVLWNAQAAMVAHDAQCAAAGITTVLDSVVLGDIEEGGARSRLQDTSIAALHACRAEGLLRVDHLLHLRCEVSAPDILEVFERYAEDRLLELVSVMDHTPGQRQWRDLASYRRYTERFGSYADAEFGEMVERRKSEQQRFAAGHRGAIVARCHALGVPLASHDDTDLVHVQQAWEERVAVSEFPTTVVAAQAARDAGMHIVMGGPNLVNGGSHSGNVSAEALAREGLLDIFSSDYVPASLLLSAFLLRDRLGWALPKAVATVTRNPARAIGLNDRGEVAVGQRADLVRVRISNGMPIVMGTLSGGQRAH
jgi:alpha-D-ribose 1-methylphosphonate 5-triphosphate diphosphatase